MEVVRQRLLSFLHCSNLNAFRRVQTTPVLWLCCRALGFVGESRFLGGPGLRGGAACVLRLWHISGAYRRWPWFFFVELPWRCVTLRQQCFRQQQLCFLTPHLPSHDPQTFIGWFISVTL